MAAIKMTNCSDSYIQNVEILGHDNAIEITESTNIFIDNVQMSECNSGVALSKSKNVTIEGVSMNSRPRVKYIGLLNFELNYLSVIVYKILSDRFKYAKK